jgi:replicative DNA helicase
MHPHDLPAAVLPWSSEAEAYVLSALMMAPDRFDSIADILTAEMFYDARNRTVYSAMAGMINAGKPVDVLTVWDRLQHLGATADIDLPYLNDLAHCPVSAGNTRRYAEIIAERALIRGILSAADKARELATEPGLSGADRLDQCLNQFQTLTVIRGGNQPRAVAELAVGLCDRMNELAEGRRQPGIATRFPMLDRLLGGGCKPGKQIVIAARPSVGKTALALEIARAFAANGHPAAVFSQEMENSELVDRMAARIGQIDLDHIQTGKLNDFEWTGLTDAVEALSTMPLYVDDQPALSLGDIQAKARKLKREHGIKLLVIDYLQLCAATNSKASRHHQIEEISRGIKVLAKQLGLTTIVLSQLSREVEKRTSGRPTLADLKESGAIEEDADTIILLSPDGTRESGDQVIHADVAKNRGGKRGYFKLAFTGAYQQFVETFETETKHRGPRQVAYTEDV